MLNIAFHRHKNGLHFAALFLLQLLGSIAWASALIDDGYPQIYIAKQLEDAQKPIEVKLAQLKPGQLLTVTYLDRPVWVYRRTQKELEYLSKKNDSSLADPKSLNLESSILAANYCSADYIFTRLLHAAQPAVEKTTYRSFDKRFLVVWGYGPQSGCILNYAAPENARKIGVPFNDPCVGADYDVAGKVLKGVLTGSKAGEPTKYNMYIPPYTIKGNHTLLIGWTASKPPPEFQVLKGNRYVGASPTEKLMIAARHNDLEAVSSALKEGANAQYFQIGKGSPLDSAIIGSSIEIINLLIAHGAKPTPNSLTLAQAVKRTAVMKLIKQKMQ